MIELAFIGLAAAGLVVYAVSMFLISRKRSREPEPKGKAPGPSELEKSKSKISTTHLACFFLLVAGALALAFSILYTSTVTAFIGLGLVLWGALLMYVHTEDHVRLSLLDSTVFPTVATLNRIIRESEYKGKAVYLPPKYFRDPEMSKAFISREENIRLPTPEQIQTQVTRIFVENPEGLLLTPPGEELSRLLERELDVTFTKVNLEYVQQRLPKLLTEELEISREFQIGIVKDTINVKIEQSPFRNLFQKTSELGDAVGLGSPLVSALACAAAKASGRPIVIRSQKTSEKGGRIEIEYGMLSEES